MMEELRTKLFAIWVKIKDEISFLPTIISIIAFGLGVFLVSMKGSSLENFFIKTPFVKIHDLDTLRAILTSFLTGLISITIFSFSMVMLVLSRAASQYSPKILNWMVGKKSNQYILGIYMGTIVYTIVLMIQLPKNSEERATYHFAVMLDAVFTFYSLTLFVKFINNVSSEIQVTNVIKNIYDKTRKKIEHETEKDGEQEITKEKDIEWIEYHLETSGYLQKIDDEKLIKILAKNELRLKIIIIFGYYHIKGNPFYCLDKKIEDKAILDSIASAFIFYPGEKVQDHTFYGFRQIAEIAVKALSPGINDPGTAIICIDYLTDLLAMRMAKESSGIVLDKKNNPRIFKNFFSFVDLFDISLIPILNYGGKDVSVLKSIIGCLRKLSKQDKDKKYQQVLNDFLKAVMVDIDRKKEMPYFYNYLKKELLQLKIIAGDYFSSVR